jgi:hypothetical protein
MGEVSGNPPRKPPPRRRPRSYHKTGLHALKRLAKDEAAWLALDRLAWRWSPRLSHWLDAILVLEERGA